MTNSVTQRYYANNRDKLYEVFNNITGNIPNGGNVSINMIVSELERNISMWMWHDSIDRDKKLLPNEVKDAIDFNYIATTLHRTYVKARSHVNDVILHHQREVYKVYGECSLTDVWMHYKDGSEVLYALNIGGDEHIDEDSSDNYVKACLYLTYENDDGTISTDTSIYLDLGYFECACNTEDDTDMDI